MYLHQPTTTTTTRIKNNINVCSKNGLQICDGTAQTSADNHGAVT